MVKILNDNWQIAIEFNWQLTKDLIVPYFVPLTVKNAD